MDKPGLVTIVGPSDSGFAQAVRAAMHNKLNKSELTDKILEYSIPIEYVFDGELIPESKVFGTDSQKGN
jgi:Tfp pilus assembly pilus retraction ATPase PilT